MRTLTIVRRPGSIGKPRDVTIISDEKKLGELKAEQESVSIPFDGKEHAFQAQIVGRDGRIYRSNSYFENSGVKELKLFLTVSGSRLVLELK